MFGKKKDQNLLEFKELENMSTFLLKQTHDNLIDAKLQYFCCLAKWRCIIICINKTVL